MDYSTILISIGYPIVLALAIWQTMVIIEKIKTINSLYKKLEEYSGYKERATELEDSIEKGYGVKIRNEVTVVKTDFTKLEMVTMLAGVHKLAKSSESIDDTKIYIALVEKIQKLIDVMKENK
jgi:hypothetical protein